MRQACLHSLLTISSNGFHRPSVYFSLYSFSIILRHGFLSIHGYIYGSSWDSAWYSQLWYCCPFPVHKLYVTMSLRLSNQHIYVDVILCLRLCRARDPGKTREMNTDDGLSFSQVGLLQQLPKPCVFFTKTVLIYPSFYSKGLDRL